MNERTDRLHYILDTGAFQIGEYVVLDSKRRVVQEFDAVEEAEKFIVDANGVDVETVRRETAEHARLLAEYRDNLRRQSRES